MVNSKEVVVTQGTQSDQIHSLVESRCTTKNCRRSSDSTKTSSIALAVVVADVVVAAASMMTLLSSSLLSFSSSCAVLPTYILLSRSRLVISKITFFFLSFFPYIPFLFHSFIFVLIPLVQYRIDVSSAVWILKKKGYMSP